MKDIHTKFEPTNMSTIDRKPKVLIVTYHYLNGVGGGVFASRAYINAFADIFKYKGEVSLMFPVSENHPVEDIDPSVRLMPIPNNSSKITRAFNMVCGKIHRYYSILPKLLSSEKYDLVVFDNSKASKDMIDIAHNYGCKVITIHHNCELEYNRDNGNKLFRPISILWTKKYEGDAVRKSDLNLVITREDKNLLSDIYLKNSSSPIEVLGAFEYKKEQNAIESHHISADKNRFVITGNLSADQTIDSIKEWFRIYYPILLKEVPYAQITLAGKNPGEVIKQLCEDNKVTLIPSPDDMLPILGNADCYICPTSLGGGLKLRVMDGLKNGLPVITHRVSARGYEDFEKAGVLYSYDSPETFRDACKWYKTSEMHKINVKGLYEEIFSFDAGKKRLEYELGQIIKNN